VAPATPILKKSPPSPQSQTPSPAVIKQPPVGQKPPSPPRPKADVPPKPIVKPSPTPVAKPKPRKAPTAKQASIDENKLTAMAAEAICNNQPVRTVEYLLIKEGMSQSDALRMAEILLKSYQEYRDQQQQKKAVMWVRLFGGLLLTAICSLAIYVSRNRHNVGLELLMAAFVVIGVVLFISGIWRFTAGARSIRPKELIAAYHRATR
jgi:uncharacterized integral membrane protein